MTLRDRREYHRALRATAGYAELQRQKEQERLRDPVYAEAERTRERERSAKRRAQSRELLNEQARKRHQERMFDPDYRATKAETALRWVKSNPAKACANVMRRQATKLNATPAWADLVAIRAVYEEAARRRDAGEPCEVDHIVPLRSKLVCGLHVVANLRLVTPFANKSKGNRMEVT